MKRFAIVDIETTGSYKSTHAITEIAIIVHDGKKITDTFQSLINPESTVSPYVSRLTGITNEMLRDAPKFYEVAKQIWNMTDEAAFIAHSVQFDYSYIREEFKNLGADFRRNKLCTVRLSRKIFPGYPSYSLANICTHLGIKIENRHRAMGDAAATATLFEMCLANDKENIVSKSLKKNSKEAILPPNLPEQVFDSLPEKTGVYYFYDLKGNVIYVGKALNIKNRIYSHFTGMGSARLSFISSIANVSYTLCGSELIALLFESSEIKRLYPLYNQAQKRDRGNYVLAEYTDRQGIQHLLFTKNHKSIKAITSFKSFSAAREFMFSLVSEFELCPKYCGIQSSAAACFDYQLKKCKGVCAGAEEIAAYNKRVQLALAGLAHSSETKMIIDHGREWNEKSVVLIENGIYKGFGYFDASTELHTPAEAKNIIQPFKHNDDIQRILNGWAR
jgi:DNA polymerase-3 subunit epsilon